MFQKFCENSFLISYSTFCKLKPFWVITRHVSDRDTCICIRHENILLVCQQLKNLNIFEKAHPDELIESKMCCLQVTIPCLLRRCQSCKYKINNLQTEEFDPNKESYYDIWQSKMIMGSDKKMHRRTVKDRVPCKVKEIVEKFFHLLPSYMTHLALFRHQFTTMKDLKGRLGPKDLLVHIDFSENYECKYSREIVVCHFGGNKTQISIHTGVLYTDGKKVCFATVTQERKHDPAAIFMHLLPILSQYSEAIENLHFLSDSPATQYRNQYMFYLISQKIVPLFKHLRTLSWNFSEAGHGKGAPDGVRAVIKRTCDQVVAGNQDISNFQQFYNAIVTKVKGVQIHSVSGRSDEMEKEMKANAKPIKSESS